ncbi:N-acetylmuramoyl-L-alanine amidase [Chitinispirillales bacterium ANBcel5]|uniref:N-acetylmuramoyl-L-alanine amidase n=1 Tax=Cellulosispirillum alkaliphilum TaxID=3039283 RepID=UPI002A540EEC|nr:N-acetylmuramoyl-L-alanine amidase [Chitinispirillales bacterium ANBcel5]
MNKVPLFSSVLMLLLWAATLYANISVTHEPDGKKTAVRSISHSGVRWVSVSDLAVKAGATFRWRAFAQRLTVVKDQVQLTFSQDVAFYSSDSSIYQLSVSPLRRGGALYLPLSTLLEVFNSKFPSTSIEYKTDSNTLLIQSSPRLSSYTIQSVQCSFAENETRVNIGVTETVEFEISYIHPDLSITFSDATINAKNIDNSTAGGFIDSIFAVQYQNSSQISFRLNKPVEKSQLQYTKESNTIGFTLAALESKENTAGFPAHIEIPRLETIVLDPGHGGRDPGAIGPGGTKEKTVVLELCLAIRKHLETAGFTVYMTREKDEFIPLAERTQFANDKKADLFISVHANAVPGSRERRETTRGYKVYFLSQARNEHERLAAMRENAVIEFEDKPKNYDNLQNILIDLAGNEYLRLSQDLCILIDQTLSTGPVSNYMPKLHLGVGQANFWVLNGAYMPSVLIEAGFISNPAEEKLLNDKKIQDTMAASISEAIVQFKHQIEAGL